jgi:D-glycerate 3-kinase
MAQVDPPALRFIVEHVVTQHRAHVTHHSSTPELPSPPLIVGVQGPQGSGKSFLSGLLRDRLSSLPEPFSAAVLSIDDLYLPHTSLKAVAEANPGNPLLQGRGQPGTHDIVLGTSLLRDLRNINNGTPPPSERGVMLPFFDKSLHGGEGDRIPKEEWSAVHAPLDVIILEGWFIGFAPCSPNKLEERYVAPTPSLENTFDLRSFCKKDDIVEINSKLADYQAWWNMIDVFVQLSPQDGNLLNVYKWRLQQEHAMKAKNGGHGMSDEQVKR